MQMFPWFLVSVKSGDAHDDVRVQAQDEFSAVSRARAAGLVPTRASVYRIDECGLRFCAKTIPVETCPS